MPIAYCIEAMATDVIMPALGVAQEKGTLVNWLKAEGDSVVKGEPLMEVETDKARVEIEAPASGILAHMSAAPGDEVPVGQRIALILTPGEPSGKKSQAKPTPTPAKSKEAPKPLVQEPRTETPPVAGRIAASPAARRIAKERKMDLAALKGTGPQGSIVAEDVLRASETQPAAAAAPPQLRETIQLSAIRRIVGERMSKSKQTAPHFYISMDMDMTEVERQRRERKERGEKEIPSINDFIVYATARVLRDFPSLNAAYTDQGLELFSDINIGMAVALEDGLIVPVIRNADRLSLDQLAQKSRELVEKAQKKKLFPLDYEGGTFTVSNLGMFGVDNFVAIINPPQAAILAVGQVAPRVVPDGQKVAIRSMMTMTLSADHRMTDGAIAAKFLGGVKKLLENPVL
ncbi:MAG TPA: dihydrolipoamide acetyltransferase family protein [Candidatus Binatia bacterium]|jgi:pyruvate dehydrogenase E2 component (dihydrolipoamide acetyltransferase)|nr:dihydrolipoamide acetyltransferase family protein [Candidatus Binatia bacterium]